jgi:5-oxoprolinase (ATP-hydrolysing)
LPDGVYTSEVSNNPLGEVLTYPLKLTVKGDEIELDFAGAPPQLPRGGLNCTLNYTAAHATYPLKCILTPSVRGNAGCYRPFKVEAPEGSMLNCTRPMAVNLRTRTGWYIAPNVFRALSEAAPAAVQAATGLPTSVTIYGTDKTGRIYSDHLFMGGGQGGSAQGDGKSGLLWPTSAANTSIELLESRAPILVEEKVYVTDTAGIGMHRGGLGQRVRLRKLEADGRTTLASIYAEGVRIATPGLFGGKAGSTAFGGVRDTDGNLILDAGTGELVGLNQPGEIAEITLCGGAGYGDARTRAVEEVLADVADGYVSRQAAETEYGVVIRDDGTLDEERTGALRASERRAAE